MRVCTRPPARRALGCAAVAALVLLSWSGGWSATRKHAVKVDASKLVWPQPPELARVHYVTQYTGELDLLGQQQKKAGMLERIAGVSITPEERPRMVKPYSVAVDSKGHAYVADSGQGLVFVFDLENHKLELRGDKNAANLLVPIGVAVDERDRLFVSDSKSHQITCFGLKGNVEAVFGAGELVRPAGMAVDDPLHRLYVADPGGKRIAVFDLDTFKLLRYFGVIQAGEDASGALINPNSIAIDPNGLLYITDAIIGRVVIYDTEGNFVRSWGRRGDAPGMFARPKGIAIDRDGHIYVADSQLNRLLIFSPDGLALLSVGGTGWGPGQFILMAGVAIDPQNRIIAVDQQTGRIEVFRYVTDAETAAAKANGAAKAPATVEVTGKAAAPLLPSVPQPAAPAPAPTIEELQKELAELKAKLSAPSTQQPEVMTPKAGSVEEAGTSSPIR